MTQSLQTLLGRAIDYAGPFPPAKLPIPEAVREFLALRESADRWIMDRFVCGVASLDEMAGVLAELQPADPVHLTVVGKPSGQSATLEEDLNAMDAFEGKAGDWAEIRAYEVLAPEDLGKGLRRLAKLDDLDVFVEAPWGESQSELLYAIAEGDGVGVKGRTGGLEAKMFPSCDDLAAFLHQASSLEIETKLTAGLHHPIRALHDSVGTQMHGFLNVFVGCALLEAENLSVRELAEVLACEDSAKFSLGPSHVGWSGQLADLDAIADTRQWLVGFGSCSIREPLDDLATIGWLEGATR